MPANGIALPTGLKKHHRKSKVNENRIQLKGKVDGLARVCPLLLSKYGGQLWEAYLGSRSGNG